MAESPDPPGATGAGSDALSYEQARAELERVVMALEAGDRSLEETLALWERGEHLAATCQRWLDGARARLAAVRPEPEDGQPAVDGSGRG
jgi:exodeoxyribonuclease VII small subunit